MRTNSHTRSTRSIPGGWRTGVAVAGVALAMTTAGWTLKGAAAPMAQGPAVTDTAPAHPLRTAGDSYADVVDRVAPSVVTVRSERALETAGTVPFDDDPWLRRFFGDRLPDLPVPGGRRGAGLGSGVIVRSDGYVLTNHHVIDKARRIEVELSDRRVFEATVVGSDAPTDLAVLHIDAEQLPSIELADSRQVRVGDIVLAVGNPLGIGQTVTMGIVSAKGRATGLGDESFQNFLQIDAPINQGNSGGALVDTTGRLVGINSQILSPSGGNIGIGFAIPAAMARNVMDQLIDHGQVRRGMLGVTVQTITSNLAESLDLTEVRGALVSEVRPDSPAEQAGLRRGDVVTAFNGVPVADSNGLRNAVAQTGPDHTSTVSLIRDGRELTLTATLAELPGEQRVSASSDGDEPTGRWGMTVQPLSPERAEREGLEGTTGVVVGEVDRGGRAAEAGILPGDIIEQVNRRTFTTVDELEQALHDRGDRPTLVLLQRGGRSLYVSLVPHRS